MTVLHPDVKKKIEGWQRELRALTGNDALIVIAYHPQKPHLAMKDIIEIVCEETGIPLARVVNKTRKREVVTARQLISYYAAETTDLSLESIGKYIGCKDHTTIIHGRKRIKGLIESGDGTLCEMILKINKRLEERNNGTNH